METSSLQDRGLILLKGDETNEDGEKKSKATHLFSHSQFDGGGYSFFPRTGL